jgi:hypothetical protein
MVGSDAIICLVDEDGAVARDSWMSAQQVCNGEGVGVCPDTNSEGENNVVTVSGAQDAAGPITSVQFYRALDTGKF